MVRQARVKLGSSRRVEEQLDRPMSIKRPCGQSDLRNRSIIKNDLNSGHAASAAVAIPLFHFVAVSLSTIHPEEEALKRDSRLRRHPIQSTVSP